MDWNMILKMSVSVLLYILVTAVLSRVCRDKNRSRRALRS